MRVSKKSDVDCGGSTKEIDEVVALEKIVAVKDKVKAAVHKFNQSEAVKKKKKKPLDPASMDDFVKANDSVLNRLMQAMAKDGIASTRHLSAVRIHLTTLEDTPKTGTINDTRNLDIVQLALAYARAGAAEPWLVAAALAAAAMPLRPSPADTEQRASWNYLDPIPSSPPAGTVSTVTSALLAAGMAGYCAPSHLTVQLIRLAESELILADYNTVAIWCNSGERSLEGQDRGTGPGTGTGTGTGSGTGQVQVVAGTQPPVARKPEDPVHTAAAGQGTSSDNSEVRLADVLRKGSARHHENFRDWVSTGSSGSRPIQDAPLAVQQQMMVAAADALDQGELVRSFENVSSLLVAASLSLEPLDAYLQGQDQKDQEDDSEAAPLEGWESHSHTKEAADGWNQQEDSLPVDTTAGDVVNAEPDAPIASNGASIASVRVKETRDTEQQLEAMKLLRTLASTGQVGDGLIASDGSEPHTPVDDSTAATALAEVQDALQFGEQPYPADSQLLDTIYLQKFGGSPDRKRNGKKQGENGDEQQVQEVLGRRRMNVGYGKVMEELCPAIEMLQRRCAALAVRCASMMDELQSDEALRGRVAGAATEAALAMGRLDRMGYASCSFDDATATYGFGKLREAVYPQRGSDVVWHMRAALSADLGESPSVQAFLDTRIKETSRGVRTLEALCKDWQLTRHSLARRGRALRHSEEYWVAAHRYDEQEANAELKTAQEMAAVSYQLGIAACRSLILGLGHPSADQAKLDPAESSVGLDHLAGQAESVCGLLHASGSLGQSSNDVANRLHGMIREASAKMQHHAVHGGVLDPRIPAAAMAVLAREQLPQMSAAQTMQQLDELVAERIEPQVVAARKAGSMRYGTGPEGRRALLAACTSSWSLACQLDALAQSAEGLAESEQNAFVEATEESTARNRARVMGIESQLALLQSRLLARAQDVQLLLQPHAGAISGIAASAELQSREQVTLQQDWGDDEGSAVVSPESLLSSPGLADPCELAETAMLAVGVPGHTVRDTQLQGVDDAEGWMHATAAIPSGQSEPYASEAWHDLLFGTEGCTTALTAWPEGSRGTVRAVNRRTLTSNSFRLPISLARPVDAGVVGSQEVQLMVGKQLAHPPRARPAVSAIDALRMLWVCAIIDTASVSSAPAARDASQRVIRRLVPVLLLRLHGPMAEAELRSNLGLQSKKTGSMGLQSSWAYDPTKVDGRRAWIVPNEAIGQDAGPVVRPGMRMEAGCVHGVLGWLSRGTGEEQQEGGSDEACSDWMNGLFVPSGLAAVGEMLE